MKNLPTSRNVGTASTGAFVRIRNISDEIDRCKHYYSKERAYKGGGK